MDTSIPAQALQLLFKKIHPHLLDAEHALAKKAKTSELERLHRRLMNAREQAVVALEELSEKAENEEMAEVLAELADNLCPMEESFQQSLILTQLCLEQSVEDLGSMISEADLESSWAKRMQGFKEELKDPAKGAEARWKDVDPDIGEAEMD